MKVLVANRSEVACRIFQACQELGLETVGVLTQEDSQARHGTQAQEIHWISDYLKGEDYLAVAQASGASCIHPGYGFLAENPDFAQKVHAAGLIWVGPSVESLRQLGQKEAAKQLAQQLGIPTLPWKKVEDPQTLENSAQELGYPLTLKLGTGGGGRGIRRAVDSTSLRSLADQVNREGSLAFGTSGFFLERYLGGARHVEAQVMGDGRGGGVFWGTRECSLQRRYQKIWEEAPGSLTAHQSQLIRDAALKFIQETQYRSLGTVEFLVSAEGKVYFLEFNPRLQVEHTVTEWVTGVDLVQAQLKLAIEGKMGIQQSQVDSRGYAIQVRLCAEDPFQGFMPTAGRIEFLKWPMGIGIRVESGIEVGQEWNVRYDSLLAKIIVYAEDRPGALQRLKYALEETVILGIRTNQSYLLELLKLPSIQQGQMATDLLESLVLPYPTRVDDWDLARQYFTQQDPQTGQGNWRSPWLMDG